MRGADQCPDCGSVRTVTTSLPCGTFNDIRGCRDCQTIWEPFDPADLIDPEDEHSSFRTACDNCAFRPGSPERSDPEKWQGLIETLGYRETPFMCHKGVPLADAGDSEHTHVHPTTPDGKPDIDRMRYRRGWMAYASRNKLHKLLPRGDA